MGTPDFIPSNFSHMLRVKSTIFLCVRKKLIYKLEYILLFNIYMFLSFLEVEFKIRILLAFSEAKYMFLRQLVHRWRRIAKKNPRDIEK